MAVSANRLELLQIADAVARELRTSSRPTGRTPQRGPWPVFHLCPMK